MSWKRLRDQKLQKRLETRARITQLIREFFIREGFLEVETPILVPTAGQEPHLNPMKVEFTTPNPSSERRGNGSISSPFQGEVRRGYLITSPEYAHKKLLAAGFEKTFEITRAFRGGEQWGGLHNPEFTILEWYRANADYTKIMDDVEKMVRYVAISVIASEAKQSHRNVIPAKAGIQSGFPIKSGMTEKGSPRSPEGDLAMTISYQGKSIDLSAPWERISVAEAFTRHAGTNLDEVPDEETFFKIFLTHIEPKLGMPKPTILYEYPASMAALARLKPSPPPTQNVGRGFIPRRGGTQGPALQKESGGEGKVAERFELYIAGIELANAFSELTDADEQRRRFMEEQKLRRKLGKKIIPLDEDFLDAVGHMPPCAGIAFGIDRLAMLLTDAKGIEEVLAFPSTTLWE